MRPPNYAPEVIATTKVQRQNDLHVDVGEAIIATPTPADVEVEVGEARIKPRAKVAPRAKARPKPALAHWEEPDGPWDRLTLGSWVMPGVWEVTSGECKRKLDKKKTKGKDGAKVGDTGMEPAEFGLRGRVHAITHWMLLQEIIAEILPRKANKLVSPLGIYHPAIALLGVTTVYVSRIRVPEIRQGILELDIDVVEWTPKPKAAKTTAKPRDKNISKEQWLANAGATPIGQSLPIDQSFTTGAAGQQYNVNSGFRFGSDPNPIAQNAWNRSGGDQEEHFRIMDTGRPSDSVGQYARDPRGH